MASKKIVFKTPGRAFLPELLAYKSFFEKNSFKCEIVRSSFVAKDNADIVWSFMGIPALNLSKSQLHIHDFRSLSLPPFYKVKNKLKKTLSNASARVFVNGSVRKAFAFDDSVPSFILEMGVSERFLSGFTESEKKYSLAYVGSFDRGEKFLNFLRNYNQNPLFEKKFLLIGNPEELRLKKVFLSKEHFEIIGPLENHKVPFFLSKADIGLNYIPLDYPYTIQPSTKLLEYIALGLKVVSTRTQQALELAERYPETIEFVDEDVFSKTIKTPHLKIPRSFSKSWSETIEASGILSFLRSNV